jgi:hypothetical protein
MSDTKALDEYMDISLHSYRWGEMSLLQQTQLHKQAAAELAGLKQRAALVDEDGCANILSEFSAMRTENDKLRAELAELKKKIICGCGTPLGYHPETDELEWCHNDPATGICKEHWDKFMAQETANAQLRTALDEARLSIQGGILICKDL